MATLEACKMLSFLSFFFLQGCQNSYVNPDHLIHLPDQLDLKC